MGNFCRTVFCVCALPALLASPSYAAEEWNVATGGDPARYGMVEEPGPSGADLLWQGGAYAVIGWAPVTDGNIMVVARCFDIGDVLHGTLIYAYDIHSGEELWSADLPVDFPSTDWRNHVSAIRDGVVYASRAGNTNASYMYALDATDGSQLWKSDDLVDESSTEGVSFAPDGDLIVGNFNSVMRIDADDGSTVWTADRNSPTSNGSMVAVFGGKAYGWAAGSSGPTIEVFDLDNGDFLYESPAVYGGYIQQVAPFVGPDGTVYAPRSQNNPGTDYLVAFEDTGSGLVEKWEAELGYVPFSSFAVGADGSVYSYSRSGEVVRLDPDDGSVLNTSMDVDAGISTYMAADMAGRVFVGSESTLYSFDADLSLNWSASVSNVDAPAIAWDGTLIVCGTGTDIRAYEGEGIPGVHDARVASVTGPAHPVLASNPVRSMARVTFELQQPAAVALRVYSAEGRLVQAESLGSLQAGGHARDLDVSEMPSGAYMVELVLDGAPAGTARMVVL